MPLDKATVDDLVALAKTIFDPEITPASSPALGDTWGPGQGLQGPDATVDQRMYTLIAPIMAAIDGRVMERVPYTLNLTMASKSRPKHWYMDLSEHDKTGYGKNGWMASVFLNYHPSDGNVSGGCFSWGANIGLAMCGAICHAWATILNMWLSGGYPLGVTQPASPSGTPITGAPPL